MTTPSVVSIRLERGQLGKLGIGCLSELCQPEVGDLGLPGLRQENVFGLQVPMRDPFRVGRSQGRGDLLGDLECPLDRNALFRNPSPQVTSVDELGSEVMNSVLLADIEYRDDVGIGERGCGPGLLLESPQVLGIRCDGAREHLDRHVAAQPRIARPVYLPHPSSTERGENLVGTEACAWRKAQWNSPVAGILPFPLEQHRAVVSARELAVFWP